MRIKLTSIMVDDQERALRFYTQDLELSLEPNANPAGKAFQTQRFRAPNCAMFGGTA